MKKLFAFIGLILGWLGLTSAQLIWIGYSLYQLVKTDYGFFEIVLTNGGFWLLQMVVSFILIGLSYALGESKTK